MSSYCWNYKFTYISYKNSLFPPHSHINVQKTDMKMLDKNTKDLWDHANTFNQIKFSHLWDDINLLLSSVDLFFKFY